MKYTSKDNLKKTAKALKDYTDKQTEAIKAEIPTAMGWIEIK